MGMTSEQAARPVATVRIASARRQSFVRMHKIATTPPYGPVMMSLDAGLQQEPVRENGDAKLYVPRLVLSSPPQGDTGAVKEAARLLANAERPVIVVDQKASNYWLSLRRGYTCP